MSRKADTVNRNQRIIYIRKRLSRSDGVSITKLSEEINIEGVLDPKTLCLIRIGIYAVTRDPVALRHFVGEAFKAGVSKEEIQAAALLAWGAGVTVAELAIPLIQEVEESL